MNSLGSLILNKEITCRDPNHKKESLSSACFYCKNCNLLICPNCALDTHMPHWQGFLKLDDFLSKGKEEYANIFSKLEARIQNSYFMKVLGEESRNRKKSLKEFFTNFEKELQDMVSKLISLSENIKKTELKLCSYLDISIFSGNEYYQKYLIGIIYFI